MYPDYLQRPILSEEINFPVCLAPMVGLSHIALRELCRSYLPEGANSVWPTEMLNSRRIPSENLKTTAETLKAEGETHLVPQILGNEEEPIRKSIQILKDWGAVGIDINMGCPVKKALRHNYGVALMGDIRYAAEVVSMAKGSSELPVSVKLRAGQQADMSFLLDFCSALKEAGADWLCLHPRTPEEKRKGRARWEQVAALREAIALPIIGNGDVQTSEDVWRYMRETRCDMVMVGRALTARPWLLWQIGEDLGLPAPKGREGKRAPRGSLEEAREFYFAASKMLELCFRYFPSSLALRKFRFYIRTSSQWLSFGHHLYSLCSKSSEPTAIQESIDAFFSVEQTMMEKTDLRI